MGQRDRLFDVDLDSGLGRNPSAVPLHLSRVLYIPRHSMLKLRVYEAAAQYRKAVDSSPFGGEQVTGKPLMGSRLFKTRLNTLELPSTEGGPAEYSVDLDVEKIRDGGDISATFRGHQRSSESAPEVSIMLPMLTDVFTLSLMLGVDSTRIEMSTTYPLPGLRTNAGVIRFPYFRFSLPGCGVYEWQIHPRDHGTLRYTLMQIQLGGGDKRSEADSGDGSIKAIYHHIGHDRSLFLHQSQGILLLPELKDARDGQLEAVVVASLVGLLWRIRGMEIRHDDTQCQEKTGKKRTLLRRVFGR